ncbi:unnamed protein product [Effrenium voratum]|uniref:Uncharacterized protein n=1 Tax=Effrenium voratum TaxID=2562239 RepID=A0AA36MJ76_9DINO|nr:unnamed protein product [Effrenium voratum]|eukprot:CAMPEP_0181471188 /NCGR_PEP_ID=MMETSP1110-20121109/38944_1 /TAXON_ID=174948 /ORGANISM="Symbiodinium sp., Strain CCMP421" /LENGTH=323 /DNA_ID=CAMNT_0023596195 /DNA_START=57 /DNA_END=1028 /DNA_ORIENTATION=+
MPEMKPMTPGLVSQRMSSKESKKSDITGVESTTVGNNSPRSEASAVEKPTLPLQKRENVAWCDIRDEEEFEDFGDSMPISPSVKSTATTPSRSGRRAERRARRRKEAQKAAQQQVNSRGPSAVTFAELGVECSQSIGGAAMSPSMEGNWPGIMSTAPADQPKAALFLPPGALSYTGCSPTAKPSDASARGYPFASPNAGVATPDVSKRLLLATSPKAPVNYGDASSRTPCQSPPSWTADVPSPCRARMNMRSFVSAASPSSGMLPTSPSVVPRRQRDPSTMAGMSPVSPEVKTLRQLMGSQGLETGEELAARLQAAAPESYED